MTAYADPLFPLRNRDDVSSIPGAIRAVVRFSDGEPVVRMEGPHPATAWMEYLHLPFGALARLMFTMPHDNYYGCQYFLEALQETETVAHLENLSAELALGLSLKHPDWVYRDLRYQMRQRVHPDGDFRVVEVSMPDQFPGAQQARTLVHLALETHRRLPSLQASLVLLGLQRMARAYLSGEVNPYDWKSLITFPQAVLEGVLGGVARHTRAEA